MGRLIYGMIQSLDEYVSFHRVRAAPNDSG